MKEQIRIAIVEDNNDNIETLKYTLSRLDMDISIDAIARTADEAYTALTNDPVDLAFLDIQLRDTNIFTVLEVLFKEDRRLPELVFLTAHGSFENALKAIQYACLDFVTKPFDVKDIENALRRYLVKKDSRHPPQQKEIGLLLQLLKSDIHSPKSIAIQLSRGIIELVEVQNIMYIEADENVSNIYLSVGGIMHSSKNFGHYLGLLSDNINFIQISKSLLVNIQHVKQYHHQDKSMKLKNNQSLIVSHRFSPGVQKFLLNNQKDLVSEGKLSYIKKLFKK